MPESVHSAAGKARPTSCLARLQRGMSTPLAGLAFLRDHRSLWRYALPPLLLNLLVTTIVLIILILSGNYIFRSVYPRIMAERDGALWYFWFAIALIVLAFLLIVCLALAFMTLKLLSGILCGYQYGRLARYTEIELGLPEEEMIEIPFRHEVVDTFLDLATLAAAYLVLMLIGTIPLLGTVLAFVGGFYGTWFILGRDFLDFPQALRGHRRPQRLDYARQNHWETVGVGSAVFVLQFVPIVSAILHTTIVVGCVLLYREMERDAGV